MAELQKCSRCGTELLPNIPGSHCLRCLLQLGLATDQEAESPDEPAGTIKFQLPSPRPAEKAGDRIGRYKLLQQIGEGGCGVVYMAEQEEPVRRRVALKVIKLGMDTKQVVARFEAERQALALMDHPNIARVFDAGPTETGRPYFVMELVRGIKITDYCDQQKLSTRQRLDLFVQVCQAVQHAHLKGVIHRDLKPSNILVTEQDGKALPKIIDFGIAKATAATPLTDKTLFTAFDQFIGTPAYMSPEQAGLGGLDIDTRSDIYSLGVLLYELLTGRQPFDPAELHRSAIDEVLRTIREKEPPRPSACLTTLTEQELTMMAGRRMTEPAKMTSILRGDLDWIVMKALEKDRTRRYETANGLASDIQRHLVHEPVLACPPGNLYRFQKVVRRHKLVFAAAGAVTVALLIGLGISTWMFFKEREASRRAVNSENTARSEAARSQRESLHAQSAEADAKEQLWSSYFAQAQARRWSGRAGRRFEALAALTKAAEMRTTIGLRNEAIACLALPDLRVIKEWEDKLSDKMGVSFDADCRRYAISDASGSMTVCRVADGQELFSLPGTTLPMRHSWFSPDGRFLAAHLADGSSKVWDLERREAIFSFTNASLRTTDFSADSRLLAMCFYSHQGNHQVKIYNLASRQVVSSFEQTSLPCDVAFNPAGDQLAVSSSAGHHVYLREVATGNVLQSFAHPQGTQGLAWHRDGLLLAVACGDHIYLWDTAQGTTRAILSGHQAEVQKLAFNHKGDLLCSTSWDNTLRLWDPLKGQQLLRMPSLGLVSRFSADDQRLAHLVGWTKVGLLEVANAHECLRLVSPNSEARSTLSVLSPDGKWLAAGHHDGLRLWDVAEAREIGFLPEGWIYGIAFHPSGRQLFTGSDTGLKAWPIQLEDHTLHVTFGPPEQLSPPGRVGVCDLDANGDLLAYAQGGGVRLFSLGAAKQITHFQGSRAYDSVALTPDGRLAAAWAMREGTVDLWDIAATKKVATVQNTTSTSCAFTPDNRWLVTGDQYEYRFWDTQNWKNRHALAREGNPGYRGFMALTRDGTVMATAHSATTIRLIATASGEELATLEAPELQTIRWISFDAGGSRLAVTCQPYGTLVWDLREIRSKLAGMKLDWNIPPYLPIRQTNEAGPFKATVVASRKTP